MAETVGTISAILSMAQVSVKASIELYHFFTTIRDAPQEIISISRDTKNFHTLVKNLETALQSVHVQKVVREDPQIDQALRDLLDPIENCHQTCLQIQERLQRHFKPEIPAQSSGDNSSAQPQRRIQSGGSVKWYFRRSEVFALIARFQLTKGMFSDAMGSLTLLLTFRTSSFMTTDQRSAIDAQGNHVLEDATEDQFGQTRKHKFDDDAGSAIIQYAEYVSNNDDASSTTLSHIPEKSTDPKYAQELLEAVHRGSIPLVEIMLKHVDADVRDDRSGRTALSFAAEAGNYDLAKLLLNHGASVNCRQYSVSTHMMPSGRFPLHWATIGNNSAAVVKLLLDHGANPNARNTAGRTVLQEACKENAIESVRVMLENGADVNGRSSNHGWAPVHEAVRNKSTELLQILLEYKPLLDVPSTYEPSLPDASPLHLAVVGANLEGLKLLLSSGADPDALMVEDITPLHSAAAMGWPDGINALVDAGASINARDAYARETPLHKGARNLQMDAIDTLCIRGADTDVKNIDGQNYEALLDCARQYPDDWRVDTRLGSYCTFY